MESLPELINTGWWVCCDLCGRNRCISVEFFKDISGKYGMNKPLHWNRLICSYCQSKSCIIGRQKLISIKEMERLESIANYYSREIEFERKMSAWNPNPNPDWKNF